jgi:hypothetical protein
VELEKDGKASIGRDDEDIGSVGFRSLSLTFPYQNRTFLRSTCRLGEPLREGHILPNRRLEREVARVARVGPERWGEAGIKSCVGGLFRYLEKQAFAIEYYQHHVVCAPTAGGVHS